MYGGGWEIEMLRITGNVLNMLLDIADAANIMDVMRAVKSKDSEKIEGKFFRIIWRAVS